MLRDRTACPPPHEALQFEKGVHSLNEQGCGGLGTTTLQGPTSFMGPLQCLPLPEGYAAISRCLRKTPFLGAEQAPHSSQLPNSQSVLTSHPSMPGMAMLHFIVSFEKPKAGLPHLDASFATFRVRHLYPSPHVTLHGPQLDQGAHSPSIHISLFSVLHSCTSLSLLGAHVFPPGVGVFKIPRLRDFMPLPIVLLQEPQSVQSPQRHPWTHEG